MSLKIKNKNLLTNNSTLVSDWHPTKNGDLTPSDVTTMSGRKVWWKCKHGHEWEAIISSRSNGNGCPYCSGKYASSDNNLQVLNPELAAQWHPTKNGNLTPSDVKAASNKKVWWRCEEGHEWEAVISNRSKGKDCPYCSGRFATSDNNLQVLNPEMAQQWHPTKNGMLTPRDVKIASNKKVWWRCEKDHEWEASICNRSKGSGCPECNKESQTSFPEQAIYFYLKSIFGDTVNRYKYDGNWEIDVFVPSLNFAIEYDGSYFHKNKSTDAEKEKYLTEKGLVFLRAKEMDGTRKDCCLEGNVIFINERHAKQLLNEVIALCLGYIGEKITHKTYNVDIDVERDRSKIYELYIQNEKENSLFAKNPELSKEWHPTKNLSISPDMVKQGSQKKVWWQCEKGHEWQATVSNRVLGKGCPYCAGKSVSADNNLQVVNPEVAKQWHPTKNGDLTPSDVTMGSGKKVWWRCEKGHEWETSISNRSTGFGCPYCCGKYASSDNNLQVLNPEVAKQWHPTKNGKLTPYNVTVSSNKKAWWQCEKGHEWETVISNRTNGCGCPCCSGKRVCSDNNLQVLKPELARQWHPTKNGELTPSDVTVSSNKKVWWQCEKGHEWAAVINDRTSGTGCAYCSGRRVSSDNNLLVISPELAKQWHPTKNGNLTPSDITARSAKKVWWTCEKGHEWDSTVANRTKGSGCPYCAGMRVWEEISLQTVNPDLAKQWHPTKNGNLTPSDITVRSVKKVWWQCDKGHEWEAVVRNRRNGVQCPLCNKIQSGIDYGL